MEEKQDWQVVTDRKPTEKELAAMALHGER